MIADILQRTFLIENIEKHILPALNGIPPQDLRRDGEVPALSEAQIQEAAATLARVLQQEKEKSSAYAGFDGPRPQDPNLTNVPALDEVSFISSTPEIGLLQTLMEKRFADRAVLAEAGTSGRRGLAGEPMVTRRSLKKTVADGRRIFNEYSQTDIRWISCKFAEALTWFRKPIPFPPHPAPSFPMKGDARLVIVGDWGSGLDRAVKVAKLMQQCIGAALRQGREVHVIHLGDIYYSGWEDECSKNFLDHWPAKKEPNVYSWCLNGNHDMYCGGRGYFGKVLTDARFIKQAGSSRFELEHPKWEILGLDTAYEDHSLHGDQATWVNERLTAAKAAGKKGMLLSHHQLFSAYESQGPKLRKALREVLDADLINTWLWGHEHRLCLYKPYQGVKNARCIGHGGVPVYQFHKEKDAYPEAPAAPLSWEFRETFRTTLNLEPWALFGFAVADFKEDTIEMRYIHENAKTDLSTGEPVDHNREIIS